ncbi:MAG: hypothetical protein HY862_21715 [Chloroflexi bacterium]|nr:hypothetical protein [Chloroflexota bacterium]
MTIQPIYHWLFDERQGNVAKDKISGVKGTFNNTVWDKFGRMGGAIKVQGNGSHINFGNVVGKFGASDFTVAFGIKIIDTHGDDEMDIIGNRTASNHRNVFSVQLRERSRIFFQVDEDEAGTNFIEVATAPLALGSDKKWHHIALVRENTTLKIYVDGGLAAQNTNTSIRPANINNGKDLKLGDWTKGTAVAQYEDLRIYHRALSDLQIENLVPPYNRLLLAGEVELMATDDAAMILSKDMEDLFIFSNEVRQLRFGPHTGATIYANTNFSGASQKVYVDISSPGSTRVGGFPRSVRVWSSRGEPFTGYWIIAAPNGEFLSWNGTALTTSKSSEQTTTKEYFTLQHNQLTHRGQFIPYVSSGGSLFPFMLLVDNSASRKGEFSFTNMTNDQWLVFHADKTFSWTPEYENRSLFATAAKIADHEAQVGEIFEGEVVLYEHPLYHGRACIISDSSPALGGEYRNFKVFPELNDSLSSVRLGANTGATLFVDSEFRSTVQDVIENLPSTLGTQIGQDRASSAKVFRIVEPETIFTSITSTLSEDYRMNSNKLEQFSAYRTILKLATGITEIEVSATDIATIEVEGAVYKIDEVRSVKLIPNEANRIMITSEADGLNTPALKFHTSGMAKMSALSFSQINRRINKLLSWKTMPYGMQPMHKATRLLTKKPIPRAKSPVYKAPLNG